MSRIAFPSSGVLSLPLAVGSLDRPLIWVHGQPITLRRFLAQVRGLAAQLPEGSYAVNLCEDRYHFLLVFCACVLRGQISLLPPSRAPEMVAEIYGSYPDSYCLGDQTLSLESLCYWRLPEILPEVDGAMPSLSEDTLVAICFTSGSTGVPQSNPKTWGSLMTGTQQDWSALCSLCGLQVPTVVATVPPQHIYGMGFSVLLPLMAPVAVHAGRPFFPEDVARTLAEVPAPRLLVTTPVHLRVLVQSGLRFPEIVGIVSATAPLARDLAIAAEACFGCELREMFGSTETCGFAVRRTAYEQAWRLLDGVSIEVDADVTWVRARHLAAPVSIADLVDVYDDGRFEVLGRQADLLEIAGKRASLSELNRCLLAIPGVIDGALVQMPLEADQAVGRIAAVVVAPTLQEVHIQKMLRTKMDPLFLPRRLRKVDALPRNETGKLPREALLALLADVC
ncbi:acyl-CoA synthetase [Xylella taiwanensis]|nr:AMP-binding protein [Xylella taiwanensis]AXI82825.1 AMP-ligase [Xylella taiwanensis]MCD8455836.1 AMP-binding protein [Xylella taiwanensis]MCD8458241.1 AMP-binding protein [Xylella taiwanensis]MCD8460378.1 AMP-binding protein [Xylella taiwanensis]MCD8463564.1 AMP-binding protein [Xylella taiwanensis]